MQECKYNNFTIRFFSQNEEIDFLRKYDFALFEDGTFQREIIFGRSKNQLIFEANKYMQQLGNCEKYIIIENGVQLIFLWTSLKGKPEKINMRGGKKQLFDYLFLTFTKKKNKCLYIGDSVEAPLAGWRNEISVDVIYSESKNCRTIFKKYGRAILTFLIMKSMRRLLWLLNIIFIAWVLFIPFVVYLLFEWIITGTHRKNWFDKYTDYTFNYE